MKRQQIKLGLFTATITVLLISMGNMPIATAINIPGTLTVVEFCNLTVVGSNTSFPNSIAGSTANGDFDLQNLGTGDSTANITGDGFNEVGFPSPDILDVTDTSYAVPTNSVALIAFTGTPQNLGTFEGLGVAESVQLQVSVTPTPPNFTGDLETTFVVTEVSCVPQP